jgi:ribonuclease D
MPVPADLPPPILVEKPRALEQLLEDLDRQAEIAVDTEADSFFNYREQVCLIQVTVEDRDYLVDPLAEMDITGLGRMLADPSKTKVFHDGEYDVLILKRDYGFEFAALFDTRVAAAALGSQNPGLASVLGEHFGLEMDKSMQRSNWSARPLSERQIAYARLDTRYLVELMHKQKTELEERGRMMIVEGECRRLEALDPSPVVFEPDDFVRIKGVRSLDDLGRQTLRELFILRDEVAARGNVPPFKVMNNESLLGLARGRPDTFDDLTRVPGFSSRQARRFGDDVLDALDRAEDKGPLTKLPVAVKRNATGSFTEEEYELHEGLKEWRKTRSTKEGLDSSLVLNRHGMERIAREQPASIEALTAVEGIQAWQVESFGEEILAALSKAREQLASEGPARGRKRRPRRG